MTVSTATSPNLGSAGPRPGLPAAPVLTFVFTDIERSTALLERLGGGYGDVLARHADIVRSLLQAHGGHEVDTQGDAFFTVFTRPTDALVFCADLQRRLAAEAWPEGVTVRLRVGAHTGSAELRRTGYVGLDVHRGARVAAAGHGGQVLLTAATAAGAHEWLPRDLGLWRLGAFRLKDIREPIELFQLMGPGLPNEFPALRTLDQRDEPPTPGESPYLGLARFEEGDAERYFGREALVEDLVGRLDRHTFLAIIGASGSGKSSLVRAGLLPALRGHLAEMGRDPRAIALLTPTDEPVRSLAEALAVAAATPAAVIIDQFEELFTLGRHQPEQEEFVGRLLALHDAGTRLVITLRADFYDRLAGFDRLRALAADHQVYLGALSGQELRSAVEGPAALGGWRFDPGLVELILHDVGDEPGALPLLSHAVRETWERRKGDLMTLRGYLDAGGVQGAIARTADKTVGGLDASDVAIVRDILLRLTELGDETPDSRRRAHLDELVGGGRDPSEAHAVLDRLVAARLVVIEEDEAEVAHEALIREWPTLREWLDADRDSLRFGRALTVGANDWRAAGREPSLLLRGARLSQAREWLAAAPSATATEAAFIEASVAGSMREAAEREEQQRRELEAARALAASEARAAARLRRRAVALAGLVVLALLLVSVSWLQFERADEASVEARTQARLAGEREQEAVDARLTAEQRQQETEDQRVIAEEQRRIAEEQKGLAEQQRELAEQQSRLSLSRQLAAQAMSTTEQPDLALLLALEAVRVADTSDARSSLLGLLLGLGPPGVSGDGPTDGAPASLSAVLDAKLVAKRLRFTPDGAALMGVSSNGRFVRGWSIPEGDPLVRWRAPRRTVEIFVDPTGRYAATVDRDSMVEFWDIDEDRSMGRVAGTDVDDQELVTFSPNGEIGVVKTESGLALWDMTTGTSSGLLARSGTADGAGGDDVLSVAFDPSGRVFAAGYWDDGAIVFWDIRTQAPSKVIEPGSIYRYHGDLVYSPDGLRLADVQSGSAIIIWDTQTGRRSIDRPLGGSPFSALFSPDGRYLAVTGDDPWVELWDLSDEPPSMRRIDPDPTADPDLRYVSSLAISPDGRSMAFISNEGNKDIISLWGLADGRRLGMPLDGHRDTITDISFSPDGHSLVSSGDDGQVLLWSLDRERPIARLLASADVPEWGGDVSAPYVSPLGDLVIAGFEEGVATWELPSGEARVLPVPEHAGYVHSVDFGPDGRMMVTGSDDGSAVLWSNDPELVVLERLADGSEVGDLIDGARLNDIVIAPDGRSIVWASGDGSVVIRDVDSGRDESLTLPPSTPGDDEVVFSMAFSPDGTLLATGLETKTIVWDFAARRPLLELADGGESKIGSVAFDPTGRLLATGMYNTAWIWDLEQERLLGPPIRHGAAHSHVTFSPDGRTLAYSHDGESVGLWDVASWRRFGAPIRMGTEVAGFAFDPTGSTLVATGFGGTAVSWTLDIDAWRDAACSIANRDLTAGEWSTFVGDEGYRRTCAGLGSAGAEEASTQESAGGTAPVASDSAVLTPPASTAAVGDDQGTAPVGEAEVVALVSMGTPARLAPGRYRHEMEGLSFEFNVEAGWSASYGVPGVVLVNHNGEHYVDIHLFGGSFYARPCMTDRSDEAYFQDFIDVETSAEAFMEQLAANPHLLASEPRAVDFGGHSGSFTELTVELGDECLPHSQTYTWFVEHPLGGYDMYDGVRARIVALDVGDQVILAVMEADPEIDAEAFFDDVTAILETMTISPLD